MDLPYPFDDQPPGSDAWKLGADLAVISGAVPGVGIYAFIDTSIAPTTYELPPEPLPLTQVSVKDRTGHAHTNHITVDGNGHLIDGATTFVIIQNRGAQTFVWNGFDWSVF